MVNVSISVVTGLMLALSASGAASAHSGSEKTAVTVTHSDGHALDGRFSLINQDGVPVSETSFHGGPLLIYFGYTSCTDACPLDAQKITDIVDELDTSGVSVAPIFITVDPQRDTPARLKEFLSAFHPRFVGLTGPAPAVHKVVMAYGSDDTKVNIKGPDSYDIDHPAIAYLMNAEGKFVELVPLGDRADKIAEQIAATLGAGLDRESKNVAPPVDEK